eukprot:scaffold2619_cov129-Cylindrotheca_fusiformis.AAC.6
MVATESDALLPPVLPAVVNDDDELKAAFVERDNGRGSRRRKPRMGKFFKLSVVWILSVILALIVLFVSSILRGQKHSRDELKKNNDQESEDKVPYWKNKHSKHQKIADAALSWLNNRTNFTEMLNEQDQFCETTVLIVRHCEDLGGNTKYPSDGTKHCSYLGFERSLYLASLFGEGDASRWPLPTRLYGVAKGSNVRQYETLQPLAIKANRNITLIDFPGIPVLAKAVLSEIASGELCDQIVVIAWKHAFIRDVATALGCGQANQGCPRVWNDYDFDSVWELKYVAEPKMFRQDESVNPIPPKTYVEDRAERWIIYGSETNEYFDPLVYSKDKYQSGGNTTTTTNGTKQDP